MAVINDVGGTSLNSFSINGGVTFYQGDNLPNVKMGKEGDYYFKSDGYMYVKRNGIWLNLTSSAMPDARTIANKVIYSNGENFDASGITYNATDKSTFMDGALSIGKHPSATNSTSSKVVPTIGWINDPTLSTNVVHRNGDETITGVKTITGVDSSNTTTSLYIKNTISVADAIPTTSNGRTINFTDKNNVSEGYLEFCHNQAGQRYIAINICSRGRSTSNIAIGYDKNNKIFTTAPNPTAKDNSNSIATTQWANNNCVMTYGNQNIAGQKTFTDLINNKILSSDSRTACIRFQNMKFAIGTIPSTEMDTQIQFRDKNDDWVGLLQHVYKNNGDIYTSMVCRKRDKSTSNSLSIGYDTSGNVYTHAPTPAANDSSTKIATTAWVNNNVNTKIANNKAIVRNDIQIFNEIIRDYWGATNQCFRAYIEFNDGFKIQWGLTTAHGQHARVDLLTPFKNKNYSVTLSRYCEEWAEGVMMQSTDHNEGFFYVTLNDPGCHWMAVGY